MKKKLKNKAERIKRSPNYKWYIAAAVFVGTFMATLDSSIINVALPTISGQFDCDLSQLQWIVTAYLLAISSLLPVFGRAADMFGRKKVFAIGFVIFTAASALCGLAPNLWFLVASRIVQAVGASMLMANSLALMTVNFPPSERGRALGLAGTVVALGSLAGPAIGGLLIGALGWRSIFYINLPIGIVGFFAAALILPSDKGSKDEETFDHTGAVLFCAGMVSLLFAIMNGNDFGWASTPIVAGLVSGITILTLFIINERKVTHPMIDLALFRIRPFSLGNLSGGLSFVAMFANNMLLPFYLQQVLHFSPSKTGLLMMAFPTMMAIIAPLSGHASDKFGPMKLTTGGLLFMAASLFYFSTLPSTASAWRVLPGMILGGIGSGLFQSPNNSSVMSAVPIAKIGVAGAINSLVRNVGMIIGIAFSVTLFESYGGVSVPSAGQIQLFMSAYHKVMLAAMCIALLATVISLGRKGYAKAD